MKRLIILTGVLILTASSFGCRCCEWMFRGRPACQPAAVTYGPCQAPVSACDPCGTCGPCGVSAGMVAPGPETYAPAITQ